MCGRRGVDVEGSGAEGKYEATQETARPRTRSRGFGVLA